ncbi:ATP-binding cassette domain-containing protein [Glaciibacter psychrotolerans]|uniref:Branched-chain amino acid transport system ATP-binding protein n=1 Tax=Glaciibacter psychrotolerans TaxID=670054 RepID=A0A7Z0EF94_9MICO|nr:ATP-binding cassette domain-containing protein [Leifsonia psychrotolerans]NYJ20443.1 branched-chain amino acid transport system ATP-binding protein [Leifsonia psychrotolerans]
MSDLRIENLSVRYGKATAVEKVSLTVPAGSVTAVVGPNGAGKSSMALGIYGSTDAQGTIKLGETDLSQMAPISRARAGMALVPQGRQLFPRLTVRENLQVLAEILKLSSADVDLALDRFPILRERESRLAGVLSGGEQQMLVVSRALMGKPKVLILDEMMTGLAPKIVAELLDTIIQCARDGAAVLILDPALGPLKRGVDRGYVLLRAQLGAVHQGPVALDAAYQQAMGVIHEEVVAE